jgi:hypothetical protein
MTPLSLARGFVVIIDVVVGGRVLRSVVTGRR